MAPSETSLIEKAQQEAVYEFSRNYRVGDSGGPMPAVKRAGTAAMRVLITELEDFMVSQHLGAHDPSNGRAGIYQWVTDRLKELGDERS